MWRKIEDRALAYELMQAGLLWWEFYGEMVPYSQLAIDTWGSTWNRDRWMTSGYGPEDNYISLED